MPERDEAPSPVVNRRQSAAWNGWEGAHWARYRERYDAMSGGAFNDALFSVAGLRPAEDVLDIGCGTGETTLIAARDVPDGQVTGVDLSAVMLEQARSEAARHHLANVTFIQGDAQVFPFRPGIADVGISRAGMHLFSDPVAAFTNIGRALREGGRLTFLSPRDQGPDSDQAGAAAALRPYLTRSSPAQHGMRFLTDASDIREVLARSLFGDVIVESVQEAVRLGDNAVDAMDFLLSTGPFQVNLDGLDPDELARLRDEVRRGLRRFETPDGVYVRKRQWLVTARRIGGGLVDKRARGAQETRPRECARVQVAEYAGRASPPQSGQHAQPDDLGHGNV